MKEVLLVHIIFIGSRIVMGLMFFVFGLNGLFGFFPTPSIQQELATFPASYFFPFVQIIEVGCALLFLINRFVPLATIVIASVVVNIFVFHLFVDPGGMVVAIPLLILNVILGIAYRDSFAGLLMANPKPRLSVGSLIPSSERKGIERS